MKPQPTRHGSKIEVYRGTTQVVPQKRTLTWLGSLTEAEVDIFKAFVATAKVKKFSFVVSRYYLDVIEADGKVAKRYGVIVDSDGQLGGLDITGDDPARTSATALHYVLTNERQGNNLLLALKSLDPAFHNR